MLNKITEEKQIIKDENKEKSKLKIHLSSIFTYIYFLIVFLIYVSVKSMKFKEIILDPSFGVSASLTSISLFIPLLIYINSKLENKNLSSFGVNFALGVIPIAICMVYELLCFNDLFNFKKYIIALIIILIYSLILNFTQKIFFVKEEKLNKTENEKIENNKNENENEKIEKKESIIKNKNLNNILNNIKKITLKYKLETILIFSLITIFAYIIGMNYIFKLPFSFKTIIKINPIYIILMNNLFSLVDLFILTIPIICMYLLLNIKKMNFKIDKK